MSLPRLKTVPNSVVFQPSALPSQTSKLHPSTYSEIGTLSCALVALLLTLPCLHRRDGLCIQLILLHLFADLYQRWCYPIDKTRVNEFGLAYDEEKSPPEVGRDKLEAPPPSTFPRHGFLFRIARCLLVPIPPAPHLSHCLLLPVPARVLLSPVASSCLTPRPPPPCL